MSKTSKTLMQMYRAASERFGHQNWWPGNGALEICVGAILTQNTNWTNVERAIANLNADGCMSVSSLQAKSQDELAELIRPAGYFNVKAKRLKNFIAHVHENYGDDVEAFLDRSASTLREELLSINGVGRETADSMILYAAGKLTFVVDTYTYRVLLRHGLIDNDYDYEMIKELLESSLPEDVNLYNDFHAQFVAVGKNYCKPNARCEDCPLEHLPHDPTAGMENV
ncbi:MAG: endonuclease III domain-containing protein [Planctomycetota bacterium]|nr:endonuclease III domain-containing protein [Planctomycetota bacterium]